MNKFISTISLVFIFYTHLIYGFEFSAMTLNTQNLFDTTDDLKKDDKAYLPIELKQSKACLLYTSPSPRDLSTSRMPSSA